jgi:transcriptional regulator with XRE-family HTH domain
MDDLDPARPDDDLARRIAALMSAIAATLRQGRAELGISQRELARRAGCSQSGIARLEAERADPPLSSLMTVLDAVGARLIVPDAGCRHTSSPTV